MLCEHTSNKYFFDILYSWLDIPKSMPEIGIFSCLVVVERLEFHVLATKAYVGLLDEFTIRMRLCCRKNPFVCAYNFKLRWWTLGLTTTTFFHLMLVE